MFDRKYPGAGVIAAAQAIGPCPAPSDQYFRKFNLELTTACNLSCPDCAAATNNTGKRPVHHHPWEYFVEAARWIGGVDQLVVIGGEPTAHPKFAEFVPRLRALFGCREMILWTNGFKVREYADVIAENFDQVYASLYDERTAPWNRRPNGEAVQFVQINFPSTATMELPHTPMSDRGSGKLCERGIHGPLAYADGLIYGCCVAMAHSEGVGVRPSDQWQWEVLATPLPCSVCCFSPK